MFPYHVLSSLILIAVTAVDASPFSRSLGKDALSFRSNVYGGGIKSIAERDRARARAFDQGGQSDQLGPSSMMIMNNQILYVADVGVGSPPTNHTLVIDTGSSLTWVGAIQPYVKTKTSHDTGHAFNAGYGTGNVTGEEWIDTITFSPHLVVRQQSIGVANHSEGFADSGLDGILGLGPVAQTIQEVDGVDMVPTVMDNLYSQGTISKEVLGVKFVPYCKANSGGELTFGGYDESATVSPVVYTPLTAADPPAYWTINQTISYGTDIIMPSSSGIVDTGTTFIYLPSDAFQVYQSKTGATRDNTTGFYTLTQNQYDELKPLTVHIEGEPFVLTPNAQIVPRSLTDSVINLAVFDVAAMSLPGTNLILGYSFLERYYSIYDTTNKRVGFAATPYTHSTCN